MYRYLLLLLFTGYFGFSQITEVDSLFREDQMYASITYNLINNRPKGFRQYGFSIGTTVGFLRDIPLSKDRKWAIAPGVGYNYNNLKQNINFDEVFNIEPINPDNTIRSEIVLHYVDFPIEFRWRNATPLSHKFWRIYTGIKPSYLINGKLKYESSSIGNGTDNLKDVLNKWQYSGYLAVGYNTWNFYACYTFNTVFKQENDGSLPIHNFNVGLIFYIL